jgi:hypothetical protein
VRRVALPASSAVSGRRQHVSAARPASRHDEARSHGRARGRPAQRPRSGVCPRSMYSAPFGGTAWPPRSNRSRESATARRPRDARQLVGPGRR